MKYILKPGFVFFLTVLLLCGNLKPLSGQDKLTISGGFGIPEYYNLGATYTLNHSQIGMGIGYLPYNGILMTASGDYYYHVGGVFEQSGKRPWFGRIGFVYNYEENYYNIWHDVFLNARIGREINFSRKLGVSLDAGVAVNVFHKRIKKIEPTWMWLNLDVHYTVLPGVGLRLFYRII
ncbi:hypothetical protein ACFLT1_08675 [Bacteroidota bacterium]